MMEISFSFDETMWRLTCLYAPGNSMGKPHDWIAYMREARPEMRYAWCYGSGPTAQRAINAAIAAGERFQQTSSPSIKPVDLNLDLDF